MYFSFWDQKKLVDFSTKAPCLCIAKGKSDVVVKRCPRRWHDEFCLLGETGWNKRNSTNLSKLHSGLIYGEHFKLGNYLLCWDVLSWKTSRSISSRVVDHVAANWKWPLEQNIRDLETILFHKSPTAIVLTSFDYQICTTVTTVCTLLWKLT